jgi:branched-subunit amino acid transport protein
MIGADIWLLLAAAFAVTYVWRGLGVILGGRLELDGLAFRWISAVAYAMLAGLIMRMLVLPQGALGETALSLRLVAAAAALAVYILTRFNMLLGVAVGLAILVLGSFAGLG